MHSLEQKLHALAIAAEGNGGTLEITDKQLWELCGEAGAYVPEIITKPTLPLDGLGVKPTRVYHPIKGRYIPWDEAREEILDLARRARDMQDKVARQIQRRREEEKQNARQDTENQTGSD